MSLNEEIFSLREAIIKAKRKAVQQQESSSSSNQSQQSSESLQQQFELEQQETEHKKCSIEEGNNDKYEKEIDRESNDEKIEAIINKNTNSNKNKLYRNNQSISVNNSVNNMNQNNPKILAQPFTNNKVSSINNNPLQINNQPIKINPINRHSFYQHNINQQRDINQQQQFINELANNIYSSRKVRYSHQKTISFQMKESLQQRLKLSIQKSPLSYSRTYQGAGQSRVSNFTILNSHQSVTHRIQDRVRSLRTLIGGSEKEKNTLLNRLSIQNRLQNNEKINKENNSQSMKDNSKSIKDKRQSQQQLIKEEQWRIRKQRGRRYQIDTQQDQQIQNSQFFKYQVNRNQLNIPGLFQRINAEQDSKFTNNNNNNNNNKSNNKNKRNNNNKNKRNNNHRNISTSDCTMKELISEWKLVKHQKIID